jgi:hypothetical protein
MVSVLDKNPTKTERLSNDHKNKNLQQKQQKPKTKQRHGPKDKIYDEFQRTYPSLMEKLI